MLFGSLQGCKLGGGFQIPLKLSQQHPKIDRATKLKLTDSQDGVVKTLGLAWNSKDDTLAITSPECSSMIPLTKRNVLKRIAMLFDPLGLVSPFVIVARCYCKSYGLEATTGTM